ncbi:MAG: DUF362 domain-containing protein [Clostridia bacterium]|nr:DUF362 domain-containing protein [Clostridia bacterium]
MRIILISLLLLLTLGFVSYEFGLFNSFIYRFESGNIEQQSKEPLSDSIPGESDINKNTSNPGTDAVSGATQDTGDKGNAPQNSNEPEQSEKPSEQSIVSIIQSTKASAKDLEDDDIRQMVRDAVNLAGGFSGIVKDGQTVVLKPNLVQKHSDFTGKLLDKQLNGITTDWRVTKAVVEMVRELNPNGKVFVMEGSAGDKTADTMQYLNYTPEFIPGVDEFIAIEEDSGGWQEFNSPGLVKVSLPNGLLHKEYYLNKKYKEADVLISIPCLKNNSGTVVTGGVKNVAIGATPANVYGPAPGNLSRTKMVSHSFNKNDLQQWIYDYYLCKPVDFVVMDGLEGFQNGPAPSKKDSEVKDKMNMRLIIAGRDAVAVDTIECLVTGWDPQSATYLRYLSKGGVGNIDPAKITIVGNRVDEVRKDFQTKIQHPAWTKITDKKAPEFAIEKAAFSGSKLQMSLSVKDAVKAEVCIDDQAFPQTFASDFGNIAVNASQISSGKHKVKISVYDRFLNCSVKEIDVTK